jgi:superoxide reductase
MAEQNAIYKCELCGNVVSVLDAGSGELICCGQPMKLMEPKTGTEEGKEKHVPVVEVNGDKVKVKVGSIPHPMEENHYIELIQVLGDGDVLAGYRPSPGEKPEAEWELKGAENTKITARALCNVHGLWISQ